MQVNPHELTVWQLGSTVVYGGAGLAATGKFSRVPPMRYLLGLGALRIVTMCCQALSLAHCAASFVETVRLAASCIDGRPAGRTRGGLGRGGGVGGGTIEPNTMAYR